MTTTADTVHQLGPDAATFAKFRLPNNDADGACASAFLGVTTPAAPAGLKRERLSTSRHLPDLLPLARSPELLSPHGATRHEQQVADCEVRTRPGAQWWRASPSLPPACRQNLRASSTLPRLPAGSRGSNYNRHPCQARPGSANYHMRWGPRNR